MTEVHGQHEGRSARVQETAGWLNAQPLTPSGDPMVLDPEPDYAAIAAHSETIKMALRSGVAVVRVTEDHQPTRDALRYALKSLLEPVDFERVVFEPDAPSAHPYEIDQVVQPPVKKRDIIRNERDLPPPHQMD